MYTNAFCTYEDVICFMIITVLSFSHISQVDDWLYGGTRWWERKVGFAFEASNHDSVELI